MNTSTGFKLMAILALMMAIAFLLAAYTSI